MSTPTLPDNQRNFFYASQTSWWLYFKVNMQTLLHAVGDRLSQMDLMIATFDDPNHGYVALSPMIYTALFGTQSTTNNLPGMSITSELEFNVVVIPKRDKDKITPLSFKEFILGYDQQKIIGQYRLFVVCDNPRAVYAGRHYFGEHKFLGDINYKISTFNNNPEEPLPQSFTMEAFQANGAGKLDELIFNMSAEINNKNFIISDISPFVVYGAQPPEPHPTIKQRPIASRRNYTNNLFQVYFQDKNNVEFKISYGTCKNAPALNNPDGTPNQDSIHWPQAMREKMFALLNNAVLSAALIYQSLPAGSESTPYYVD